MPRRQHEPISRNLPGSHLRSVLLYNLLRDARVTREIVKKKKLKMRSPNPVCSMCKNGFAIYKYFCFVLVCRPITPLSSYLGEAFELRVALSSNRSPPLDRVVTHSFPSC